MTRYTVVWSPKAENQLADVWTNAADRQAVTDAANAIDDELAYDPQVKGTALTEGMRSLDISPLHCLFVVEAADRIARVVLLRRFHPPKAATSDGNGQLSS